MALSLNVKGRAMRAACIKLTRTVAAAAATRSSRASLWQLHSWLSRFSRLPEAAAISMSTFRKAVDLRSLYQNIKETIMPTNFANLDWTEQVLPDT